MTTDDARDRERRHFFLRRLHSLSGVVPVDAPAHTR